MKPIETNIRKLASRYAQDLRKKMDERVEKMKEDDKSHYLIYQVLGITNEEGELIDIYENKGRFLYKYAGAFLEEATVLCFREKFPDSKRTRVENLFGKRPKAFEIDCLIGNDALEIKWRDATTDGDHITKEHTRVKTIKEHGLNPIRVMFYYPNREQAIKIQDAIQVLYRGLGGEYYMGDNAWAYVENRTEIDLKSILMSIAKKNTGGKQK